MTNIDLYRSLADSAFDLPLFSQPWWLDTIVGPGNWDVVAVSKNGSLTAAMPFAYITKYRQRVIGMPPLTPFLGPWLAPASCENPGMQNVREKQYLQQLIDQLPKYSHFHQYWHFSQTNWLPFFWSGFQQSTRYTYRVQAQCDEDLLWTRLTPNVRNDIRKARSRYHLDIHDDSSLNQFWPLNLLTFQRQGLKPPYSRELVSRLDTICTQKSCRRIFTAHDPDGNIHAGIYIVWDNTTAYYLMGGANPSLRNSGATTLCLWAALCFANSKGLSFDFEGSMMKPVEHLFASFGSSPTPYFSLTHTPSSWLRLAKATRSLLTALF